MTLLPGPTAPAAIQTWQFARHPTAFLERAQASHGSLFVMRLLGNPPWVCLSDPMHLETMYGAPADQLASGAAAGQVFAPLTGWSASLTMDGPSHQKRRRLLLPIFSTLQVKRMLPVITAIANRSIDCWPRKGAFALQTHLQRISARVVMAGIFGADDTDSTTNLASSVARLSEIGMNSPLLLMRALQWDLGSGSPWGRIVRLVRETRAVIRAAVELRRSELPNDRSDAMSVLVGLSNEQDSLSNEAIIDELIALSIAAYETTHVATAWVFACLLSARPSLERVREEVCGSTGEDTVLDLPYLDAVVRESLRLRPASPICGGRMILRPITIGDFLLPIGMIATNCSYLLHRRPDLFPDPATFRPERFLGAPTVATTTFGGGGRSCPGRPLALAEIKVVVATALARVDLRLCRPPVPAVARGIHLVPRHGLTVEAR